MREFDHSDIDGRLLQTLLAVFEEGAITRAAARLGVTQSAVSHSLDKLRGIVGDPLFVKSGRGIRPTSRAEALAARARVLLDGLREFATAEAFDPARIERTLTVAANDFQRDLLLPRLLARLQAQAPGIALRVIASGIPSAEMLRDDRCQLVVSPRPPLGSDILQKRLFEDRYRVFFDATRREAPASLAAYQAAGHVTVLYESGRMLDLDQLLAARGMQRRFVVTVPGFAGVPAFLRGTTHLATLPGLLRTGLLQGLASAAPPFDCPPMPMYMIWHRRLHADPLHRWLRAELEAVAATVAA